MIFRAVAYGLVLLTALLFQAVVAPSVRILEVAPAVVSLLVLVVGMQAGPATGLRYGFVSGLAVDLLAGPGEILGVSALLLLLAGYAAGMARPFIAASQLLGQILLSGVGVAVLLLAEELFAFLLGAGAGALDRIALEAVISGLYAAALSPLACAVVGRIASAAAENA